MKRFWLALLSIILSVPLAVGGMVGIAYFATGEGRVPRPSITVLGQELVPEGYSWREPVFGGLIFRDFVKLPGVQQGTQLVLQEALLSLKLPEGYSAKAAIMRGGAPIWTGSAQELENYRFTENGLYQLQLSCQRANDGVRGYGSLDYVCNLAVAMAPSLQTSEDWVYQGGLMAIRINNLPPEALPFAITPLGDITFMPDANGGMLAFIPISHDCAPGPYTVDLFAGQYSWQIVLQVLQGAFATENIALRPDEVQRMINYDDVLAHSETSDVFLPILSTADPDKYWDAVFLPPAQGELITSYGLIRRVGYNAQAIRHTGIDIKAKIGDVVLAPNTGRVVFAGYNESTGNTVIIEHGGGLKSLLFYMRELNVRQGDYVIKGEELGRVGSTGRAGAIHLHYELRLGTATLNPSFVFSETSRLYFFEE